MKIVIIGGSAGGASIATRARRALDSAAITLFERTPHIASAYCGLPYHIGGVIAKRETLLPTDAVELARRHRLDIRTRHEVLGIDRDAGTVRVRDLAAGREFEESYDRLILATGAQPVMPPLPGVDLPGVFPLRNLPDLDRIMAWIGEHKIRHATVIGGGFIGLELTENLVQRGFQVSLIEAGERLMPALDPEFSRQVLGEVRNHGVDARLGRTVTAIRRESRLNLALENGESIETDLVLVVPGVRPDNALAREAGLALGNRGGVVVDERQRTADEHIYAVGDGVETTCAVSGACVWSPLAVPLNQQVRVVAAQLAGEPARYRGTQGTFICKVFDLTVAATGLGSKRLREQGRPFAQVLIPASDHVGFYPGAETLYLKLLFDPNDGKLLGAQAAGRAGVDKRIDVLATALAAGMTVNDLESLELAYAPSYGSPRDPVNLAGAVATHLLKENIRGESPETLAIDSGRGMFLLDVRTREEHEFNAIPGAVNIPADTLRERLDEIPVDRPVVVLCQIGAKAHSATRILSQNGFDARSLIGGYRSWRLFHDQPAAPQLLRQTAEVESIANNPAPANDASELDIRGLACPGPIVRVRKHIDSIGPGTTVRILASDPGFPRDFRLWCKKAGHQIVEESNRPGDYRVVCLKN